MLMLAIAVLMLLLLVERLVVGLMTVLVVSLLHGVATMLIVLCKWCTSIHRRHLWHLIMLLLLSEHGLMLLARRWSVVVVAMQVLSIVRVLLRRLLLVLHLSGRGVLLRHLASNLTSEASRCSHRAHVSVLHLRRSELHVELSQQL